MAQLNPYLHFDGTCREAMEFYKESLGGELTLLTVKESGMADQMPKMPAATPDKIMHSILKQNGWSLMASDMMDPASFTYGDNVNLCLVCQSKKEIEELYSKLSAGGKIFMELSVQPFGTFGMFTDKFGIDWMVQFDGK